MVDVTQITDLPIHFDRLLRDAEDEGNDIMSVLRHQWLDGSNRFKRPGEMLALATFSGDVAGIGGVTQDFVDADWLRLRRVHVSPTLRRLGIGRKIARYVLERTLPFSRQIVLHADGPEAVAFCEALGFGPIDRENTTHIFLGM